MAGGMVRTRRMVSAASGWSGRVWARRTRIALSRAFLVAAVLERWVVRWSRKPVTVPRSRSSSRSWSALVPVVTLRCLIGVFPKKWRRSLCREFVDVSES